MRSSSRLSISSVILTRFKSYPNLSPLLIYKYLSKYSFSREGTFLSMVGLIRFIYLGVIVLL